MRRNQSFLWKQIKFLLFLTFSSLSFLLLFGCQRSIDKKVFLKGPYLQNVTTDGITVMWESKTPCLGTVFYKSEGTDFRKVVELREAKIHEIKIENLTPETEYAYFVASNGVKSPKYSFKTAVRKNSPFSFATYGDTKHGPFNYRKIAKLISEKHPNFVIHNGDFVERGEIYKQWEKLFFTPARDMLAHIPLFGAIGNHEDNSSYYYQFFSFPGNERWYSFDFGNAHFIILDTNDGVLYENSEEYNWLIHDLQNNHATWTIVSSHHPPFTAGGNYYRNSRLELKKLLHPLMEKYGVDLVLSGHDHNYERTKPISGKKSKHAVTYVVCGNGGTPMRYIGWREWTQYAERVFGFVLVHIDGSRLHFQAININGEVIDEFTLDKSNPESVAAYLKNRVYLEDIDDHVVATKNYHKGRKLLKKHNYEEAVGYLQKAYAADSTCIEALSGLARCYFESGKIDSAILLAKRAVQKKPNYPHSYEVLVDIFKSKKEYDKAIEWCKKWYVYEPDSPDANNEIADIYKKQKKYDLAIAEMKKAIAINPADSDLYIDLGGLYEKVNNRKKALQAYRKAVEWYLDEKDDKDIAEVKAKIEKWANN
ncbi:MAG: tetratricopeptide repeat protein [Calditrichaeota bacterium]|nr:tetratricopeptide repeat protein [Calditrichota bacterium]